MIEHLIGTLGGAQHGAVGLLQLREAGVAQTQIDTALRTGRLLRVHEGVYVVNGAPASVAQERMVAVLAVGPDGSVSHRAASAAVGCWGGDCPVEVSVPRERAPRPHGVVVHRSRDLVPDHVVVVDGIPTTSPVRTLVDLGQVASWWTVGDVLDRMLRRKLVTPSAVRAGVVLHSRRGRRGVGPLRRALAERDLDREVTESALEDAFAALLERAGLPLPVPQHIVHIGGQRRRIDFAYPDLRLAIELDGYEFHAAPGAFEADRIRSNELTLLGWRTVRFTWHQVVHQPDYVLRVLRALVLGK